MGLDYSGVVAAPCADVFAWHARPGALPRLAPPWQPVRVVREAASLSDGRAVLALPGGLHWVAEHDPAGYRPGEQFVDAVTVAGPCSLPLGTLLRWRHTHTFRPVDETHTLIHDTVDTPVPGRLLTAMFDYRLRQLNGDLAAHQLAAAHGCQRLTVAVTGSSGLVGTALTAFLSTGGHTVIRLVRGPARSAGERQWRPDRPDPELLAGVDAVIHLAGAGIAGRFTPAHRAAIRDSRVAPTRRLAELAARTPNGPMVFVAASAVGWYGADRDGELLTEDSVAGTGFLADVVAEWEAATATAERAGLRVARIRTGIVQSPRGGTLRLLGPLFYAGLGGRLGDGRQWMSWIGIDDLLDIYHRALWDHECAGPINATAPNPVTNADYTRILAHVLGRPALLPVPDIGPRVLLGREGARELALAGQRVLPARLTARGHRFRQPDLESALRHLYGRASTPW